MVKPQAMDALQIAVASFNEGREELVLRCHGNDRPGIISAIAGGLEANRLYVESIVFNLLLPATNQCEMHLTARGSIADLRAVLVAVETAGFLAGDDGAPAGGLRIHWPEAQMFHVALMTPDRPGLVAKIASIVGQRRDLAPAARQQAAAGSFVHLIGLTHNSAGPHGGTAYFSLRALVATQTLALQRQIEHHLRAWAKQEGIEDDLWLVDLNRPAI